MEKMKGFMTKVRRRRLALFLVFALMLGIAPKVDILALGDSGDIAGRHVGDEPTTTPTATGTTITTPTPTEDPSYKVEATTFLNMVKDLLNTKFAIITYGSDKTISSIDIEKFGERIKGSDGKYTYTGKLKNITDYLDDYGIVDENLNNNPVVRRARSLTEENANDYVTAYLNILTLLGYIDDANEAISETIRDTNITGSNYNEFATKYLNAKSKLEDVYYKEFETLQNLSVLGDCLGSTTDVSVRKDIKNARIIYPVDHLSQYEDVTREYNILDAYIGNQNCIYNRINKTPGTNKLTYVFDSTTCNAAKELKQIVVDNGGDATLKLLYNGTQIGTFLGDYQTINNILAPIQSMSSSPTTAEQIQEIARVQKLYNDLDDAHKAMVPEDVVTMIKVYGTGNIEVGDVSDLVKNVCGENRTTYPKTDTEYKEFKKNYNIAYSAYLGLLGKYGTTSGVERLIVGIDDLLGDMTTVYNFLERVHDILNTEDNQICNRYNEMERIVKDYNALSVLNQSRIYNYAAFNTVYQNATVAEKLRTRIDKLLLTLTADELDRQEVAAIRKEYSGLNAKAKAYFGTSYANYIDELEYGNYAKSLELASRVDELIGRIGTINTNSGQKIADAENAYNALTDMQKALVKTYATLVAARKAYDLIKNDVSKAKVLGIAAGYVYTRKYITPSPRVFIDNKQLVAGTDYTLSYSKNKSVGTAKITITAVSGSGYFGTYTKSFKIVKDSISDGKVSNVKSSYKYTGKSIKPTPKLKVNGYTLKKGTDYTVSYSKNKKKGKATITLKGKGNYKGTKKKTFKIK